MVIGIRFRCLKKSTICQRDWYIFAISLGETLVKIDLPFLKTTGFDLSVILVVLNSNGKEIQFCEYGDVK